jgi:hypothetical protein
MHLLADDKAVDDAAGLDLRLGHRLTAP